MYIFLFPGIWQHVYVCVAVVNFFVWVVDVDIERKINAWFLDCTASCSQKSYVANNNSRSLRGVSKSSSTLNFGMFVHSGTLMLRFAHFMSKAGGFE